MSLNVFIKIDMSGAKSKAFRCDPDHTIKDLKDMCLKREGHELETLMYRAKPCQDHFKLSDINFRNDGTFFASLRLKGGAMPKEGNNATQFNRYIVSKLGAKHGASVTTDNCKLGNSDGCSESGVLKCKFSCGCIYCPDCFQQSVKSQLGHNGVTELTCGWTSHADSSPERIIDADLAFAVCAFSDAVSNTLTEQIDTNALNKPISFMKSCFKCGKFMVKKVKNDSLVEQCPSCMAMMCWVCRSAPHDDPMDCIDVASVASLIAYEGNEINIYGKQCWNKRVCINRSCREVNVHNGDCNHMTCKCGAQYCHWCLQPWKGHNSALCIVKGKENITAKYLFC